MKKVIRQFLFSRVAKDGNPKLPFFNRASFYRSLYLKSLLDNVSLLPGAIVECGAGQGRDLPCV